MKKPNVSLPGPLQTQLGSEDYLSRRTAYDGSNNPEYIGLAEPGTATSAAFWQIRKIEWTGGNPTASLFAESSADFDKVWDDRATYTYG